MCNLTSVAQFWRSPQYSDYVSHNVFLPIINNEVDYSVQRWKNFVSVEHVYLFASDGGLFHHLSFCVDVVRAFIFCLFALLSLSLDATIVPWQSSHFGFFDSDGETVIPMEDQKVYVGDLFGLRTLAESKRLDLIAVPGKSHSSWLHHEELFDLYTPYFD